MLELGSNFHYVAYDRIIHVRSITIQFGISNLYLE
jgi:hypothetical protein